MPWKNLISRRLRSFIQEGIEDGSIASCDPKIAAFSIAGAVNWICMWYEPEGAFSAEEIAFRGMQSGPCPGLIRAKMISRRGALRGGDYDLV